MGTLSGDKLGLKKQSIFIIAIAALVLAVLHVTVNRIGYQTGAVRNFVPVEAKVIGKNFKAWTETDSSGTFYDFTVTYTYQVNGTWFTCDKVSPLGGGFGLERSKKLYATYNKGQLIKAYYNPKNPNQAFLIFHIDSGLYIVLLIIVASLSLVTTGYFEAENYARNGSKFYHVDDEEYYWDPKVSIPMNFWKYCAVSITWHVAGISSIIHYLSVVGTLYETSGIIAMATYEVIGLMWLVPVIYYRRNSHFRETLEELRDTPLLNR